MSTRYFIFGGLFHQSQEKCVQLPDGTISVRKGRTQTRPAQMVR
jgi:hypothetical protein